MCINGELSEAVYVTYSVTQGAILDPKNYIMYTKPVGSICRDQGLSYHFYNAQLYPTDNRSAEKALCRIESGLSDIVSWVYIKRLKLNTDKTIVTPCCMVYRKLR